MRAAPLARPSLSRRLFLLAAFWMVVILGLAGVLLSAYYRTTAEAAFDERLGVYLRALVADVAASGDDQRDVGQLGDPQFELVLSGWYWQITRLDSEKPDIRSSRSLFAARLPRLAELNVPAGVGGARSGYAEGPDGRRLRIVERQISVGDNGLYLVQVAATTEAIDAQISRFELALAIAFALLAAGLLGVIAVQIVVGLRPLRTLETSVNAVRTGTSEKVEGVYPTELAPLADELNLLVSANRDVVERARTQVGNLAHALKTPLSVLFNEAGEDDGPLAAKVREQAAIMRDQVAFYLDRARAAARAGAIGATTDVGSALDALLRTFRKIHREREIACIAPPPATSRFLGESQDFDDLVGNLLDNACKWAAERVDVSVALEEAPAGRATLEIVIDDDGPGLSPDERVEAVRRGRRLDETKPGSGLGLSIVTDLAAAYGGSLALDQSPLGGLRATLRLPGV
ncbi:MAG: sensor histidine kinase [Hyphomicrobiales bacterium]|nr:sensor histidine kinase [Hyphomicrobiales bacterium]